MCLCVDVIQAKEGKKQNICWIPHIVMLQRNKCAGRHMEHTVHESVHC